MKFLLFTALLLNIVSNQAAGKPFERTIKIPTGAKHLLYMQDPKDLKHKLHYLSILTAKSNNQHEFTWYKASKDLPELYELIPDAQLTVSLLLLHAHEKTI